MVTQNKYEANLILIIVIVLKYISFKLTPEWLQGIKERENKKYFIYLCTSGHTTDVM